MKFVLQVCDPPCQLRCLAMHNYYRSLHNRSLDNSPPMKCGPGLTRSAQDWTDAQARNRRMRHLQWTDKFTEVITYAGERWLGKVGWDGRVHK